MNRMQVLLLAGMMAALGTFRAAAQVPGMFPWWDNPIAQDLGLSEAQNKQIRSTVREFRDRILKLNDAVEDADIELKNQMNADPVDAAKADAAINKVVAARGELTRAVSQMSLKLRMILNPTQWQELQRRQPRPPQHDRGPGPGMHGPGRPDGGPMDGGRRGPGGPGRGPQPDRPPDQTPSPPPPPDPWFMDLLIP